METPVLTAVSKNKKESAYKLRAFLKKNKIFKLLNFIIMKIYLKKDKNYNQLCFKAVKELPMNIKQAWYTRNKFFSFLIEDYGMYMCLTIYK